MDLNCIKVLIFQCQPLEKKRLSTQTISFFEIYR